MVFVGFEYVDMYVLCIYSWVGFLYLLFLGKKWIRFFVESCDIVWFIMYVVILWVILSCEWLVKLVVNNLKNRI